MMKTELMAMAIAATTLAAFADPLPEKTIRQLDDVRNVCGEMAMIVPQLEARGMGQYSRMQYEILRWCLNAAEKEDLTYGFTNSVIREAREMTRFARPALERAKRILAGTEKDLPVPRYKSGPIRTDGALIRGNRVWPDGRVEKDAPIIFNGWGHFGRIRKEMHTLDQMGYNCIQIEHGIYNFFPHKGFVLTNAIHVVSEVLDDAWKNNTRVNFLFAPHYVPGWIHQELPKGNGRCDNGFIPICIHDPHVNSIFADYCGFVAGLLKDNPAVLTYTLTNEPHGGDVTQCKSMKRYWVAYLAEKYGTIAALNAKWKTAYASFDDVEMQKYPEVAPTPAGLEFIRCERNGTSDFHALVAAAAKKVAPNVPVESKIVSNEILLGKNFQTFWSIDAQRFAEIFDYLNNDPLCFTSWHPDELYANRWVEMEAGYDYQRSFAAKPIINTENHNIVDGNFGEVWSDHVYAAFWQNVIHGQVATDFWCWERATDNGSIMRGLAPEHPDCLEAMGRCSLDTQRLSKELAPIQAERPTVLVMHSLSTEVLNGKGDGKAFLSAYAAANFLGETTGIVTDEALARYDADGVRRMPLDSAKAIVLPDIEFLPTAALSGLRKLETAGVKVVVVGKAPKYDDYRDPLPNVPWTSLAPCEDQAIHAALVTAMGGWNLDAKRPRAYAPETKGPAFGVETRGYVEGSARRISLCNLLQKPTVVELAAEGTDLITGKNTARRLELKPLVPMFVEY